MEKEQKFWILVNKAEANFGMGIVDEHNNALSQATEMANEGAMHDALTNSRG